MVNLCFTDPEQVKIFLYLLGYFCVFFPGSQIISAILSKFTKDFENDESGLKGAGKMIGIIERILVITFVFINEASAISMIFAAKSIVRFSDASNNRKFAEYYLIGTLASISFSLLVGTMISYLVKNHLFTIFILLDP